MAAGSSPSRPACVASSELPAEDELDPPSPLPWRCFDLGAACARIVADSPYRVALIASSSWSHAFLTPKNYLLYPDVPADRGLYDALVKSDYAAWRERPLSAVEDSGQQEILNWMCLMGAMNALGRRPTETSLSKAGFSTPTNALRFTSREPPPIPSPARGGGFRMGVMPDLPGEELAQELIGKSRAESSADPDRGGHRSGRSRSGIDAAAVARLIGRLWTLERMFYYIYGGWGQGLEMNDFPALGQIPVLEADRR